MSLGKKSVVMFVQVLSVACVLLFAATQVQCQNFCYQYGADCKDVWNGKKNGGWLQAMQMSRARAQGADVSAADIDKTYCECCCTETPCKPGVCGNPPTCPIVHCYARVLGEEEPLNRSLRGT